MADRRAGRAWQRLVGLAGIITLNLAGPAVAAPDQPADDLLAKGKYLVTLGDCASCHTAVNGEKFAGGRYMPTPFGPISTPNITPDKDTGIGNWTDDQFYAVLHQGIDDKGAHIYPVMPYPWYTKVTHDDVLAIKAYLFSLKPVNNKRPPNKLAFPFNVRAGLAVWNQMFLVEGTFKPDPAQSPEVNRGAYIVQGLGHCGECHNGRNLLGDTKAAASLQGGPIENWYAPNITNDIHDGVGKYSDDQLMSFLKTGVATGIGVAAGPMAETIHESLRYVTDADIHAIIAYLRSVKAETSYTASQRSDYTGPDPEGRQVYLNNCASCHQLNGNGIEGSVPSLIGNGAVLAAGPEDVIRVILGGIEAQGTYAPMPAVAAGMTDDQVAQVTNYIRQSWGNQAPPNAGGGTVGKLRGTTFTAMSIGPNGHCPTVVQPDLVGVINDPKSGIQESLRSITQENIVQTASQVVQKVKTAVPHAQQADIINSLTIAYCPVVEQDAKLPLAQKVEQLGHFSERVYSELQSGGKE